MSTPESITVDLDHAKQLKEAGWQEETVWQWQFDRKGSSTTTGRTWYLRSWSYQVRGKSFAAAPTMGEIITRLPCERRYLPTDRIHDPNAWAELWITLNSK